MEQKEFQPVSQPASANAPQSAEAESNNGGAANAPDAETYGKFKNAAELLNAYTSLEKEFTRRSQELSELRKRTRPETPDKPVSTSEESKPRGNSDVDPVALRARLTNDEAFKKSIIAQYLSSVRTNAAPLMGDAYGAFIYTPPKKPRTLEEAGEIAEKYFK